MRRFRIVIADRHPIVLQGISSVISTQHDLEIVASCGDGGSCIEAIRLLAPDIAVVDAAMPGISRPELLALANTGGRGTLVVFFAGTDDDHELQRLAADGACIALTKQAPPETLVATLRKGVQGQGLGSRLPRAGEISEESDTAGEEKSLTQLTARERQIMRLVSEGLSNKGIGRRLNIADGTIKVHLHHIFQKLDISNRTVLATLAISQNEFESTPRELDASGLPRDPVSAK